MNKKRRPVTSGKLLYLAVLFSQLFFSACENAENTEEVLEEHIFLPENPDIVYHGRLDFTDSLAPAMFWAGSGFTAWFEGTSVEIMLDDAEGTNYYDAIIDDRDSERIVIHCGRGDSTYLVAGDLEEGIHKIQVLRRTDPTTARTEFRGLKIFGKKDLKTPPEQPSLKIEFYGNSITSGHGILDESRENNDDRATWDNYQTYAAKAARAIHADYRCISMSGIGVMVSWYPLVMPKAYDRTDPNNTESSWDFSRWQADIVVVNLFQNDAWLINTLPVYYPAGARINAYFNFIQSIREKYADARIICTLGNMDACRSGSPWPGYIQSAVNRFNNDLNDKEVYFLPFTSKNTKGHPTVSEHQQMADVLIPFIESIL
jgi:hypothetical protein